MRQNIRWYSGILFVVLALVVVPDAAHAQRNKRPNPPKKPPLPVREKGGPVVEMVGVDPVKRRAALASAKKIDELINQDLKRHNIQPNPRATDEQFVRRAYLTLTGTIPMAAQAESFVRRTAEERDLDLVDHLLGQPAHASHQYNQWADTLRLMDSVGGDNHLAPYQEWVKDSLRKNKPYNQFVREMLTAEGAIWDNPAVGYKLRDVGMPLDSLNNTVRIFLGTQIGCAQCHDHPFDRWKQKEFYDLAAFVFGGNYRVRPNPQLGAMLSRFEPKNKPAGGWIYDVIEYESTDGRLAQALQRKNGYNFEEDSKRQLKFPKDYAYSNAKPGDTAQPAVIFGDMPELKGKGRYEAFAEWLTSGKNPRFAKTIANRQWKHAFGRGLIEPVDDMRDDTVASNPELMAFLEQEMVRLDFNLREFYRILCYTEAFRRQVTYDDIALDEPYHFPGPVLRRMSAEQIWDSLITLTMERPVYTFDLSSELANSIRLDHAQNVQDVIVKINEYKSYQKQANEERKKYLYKGQELLPASELRQPLPAGHFLREFGQSNRDQIDDSTTEGTVPQLLAMFNGNVTHMMLEEGSVIYNRIVAKKTPELQIDAMFWSILSRTPTPEERRMAMNEMRQYGRVGYGNVVWALLNTREFLFIQ
ncbi:MAG TPA: DUF1549 and DUF1553 domain-containing protein [Planctomicrobium sp.]|nr:DUF1549 and DUF1553 domain-containing protein [Planctomicrobium sp.]